MKQQTLTPRQYAAAQLRIPLSGTEWLDNMIRASNRQETALAVAKGILSSSPDVINWELPFLEQRIKEITDLLIQMK